MIKTIEMYHVVCDHDGCEGHPRGDSYAFADLGAALDDAVDGDWCIRDGLHLCPEHGYRTVCMGDDEGCPRRDVSEADDGWVYCPAHLHEGMDDE